MEENREREREEREVYQAYARRSPEDVHAVLRAAGADYLVLEDSIMDGPGENDPDLVPASHPRFCEAVKTDAPAYGALFTPAFRNKTFHVYRLKKKRKRNAARTQ
ncbi:hypothetical protein CRUP_005344 [Coryphaenoides rupestris]|nr:hypothetical protein CRUP_005344 [Coryphaenoides rupestris]